MNTRVIAESGLFTGLSIVVLIIAAISPINKLFIAGVSALILEVFIKRHNPKKAFLVFLPTAIISFLFLPYKSIAILYIFAFGGYSMIRSMIKTRNLFVKKTMMVIYANTALWLLFLFANILFEDFFQKIISGHFWQNLLFFFVIQLVILLYDYLLDLASGLLLRKLKAIGF
ncbi:MAG TPA: hypothetical protein PLI77_02610 [Bacteroidales bacterium]|nr:hypothetical protein [Bacteroidales bacterium]